MKFYPPLLLTVHDNLSSLPPLMLTVHDNLSSLPPLMLTVHDNLSSLPPFMLTVHDNLTYLETLATEGTQDKQSKNTTQYMLDTTISKTSTTRLDKTRVLYYKQLDIKTNRTSLYAEIVMDITPRNSECKDT
jgi:hypothetical protein